MRQFSTPKANIQVAADVVAFTIEDNQLKVLLIKRSADPFKHSWSLPGGFLWEDETTKQAAARVLQAKAGVSDAYIEQLYTFDDPDRDPRGRIISVTYFALAAREDLKMETSDETQLPTLFPVSELPKLGFDHGDIIQYALNRLKSKILYTNAAYSLLPESFTFQQLQQVYEAILAAPVDRRNFRKKFMSLGLIKPLGERTAGQRHRPAELYSFVSRQPVELDRAL